MTVTHDFDVLVIGSGAAGLSLALHVADHASVAVLSKNKLSSAMLKKLKVYSGDEHPHEAQKATPLLP